MTKRILLIITFLCIAGCNLKTDGTVSVKDPIRVKVDDISLNNNSDLSIKTIQNYFCQTILESIDSVCVSIVADGENLHYLISLDSGRTNGIKSLSLAVDGVPVLSLCEKCTFKNTIKSKALILSGSVKANERIANSVNTVIYSIQKNGVEEVLFSSEIRGIINEKEHLVKIENNLKNWYFGKTKDIPDISEKYFSKLNAKYINAYKRAKKKQEK